MTDDHDCTDDETTDWNDPTMTDETTDNPPKLGTVLVGGVLTVAFAAGVMDGITEPDLAVLAMLTLLAAVREL